jgi:hypothetical protein
VALQAERAHVGEIALSSTFGDRHDVVGIPYMPPAAPVLLKTLAGSIVQFALVLAQGFRIDAALRADAAIARENLLAKIAGIGSQPPLVDTDGTAEREPAAGSSRPAPPAQAALPLHPTSGLGAASAHTRSS